MNDTDIKELDILNFETSIFSSFTSVKSLLRVHGFGVYSSTLLPFSLILYPIIYNVKYTYIFQGLS